MIPITIRKRNQKPATPAKAPAKAPAKPKSPAKPKAKKRTGTGRATRKAS